MATYKLNLSSHSTAVSITYQCGCGVIVNVLMSARSTQITTTLRYSLSCRKSSSHYAIWNGVDELPHTQR